MKKTIQQENKGGCDTCAHCVKVNTAYFCEVMGDDFRQDKLLWEIEK